MLFLLLCLCFYFCFTLLILLFRAKTECKYCFKFLGIPCSKHAPTDFLTPLEIQDISYCQASLNMPHGWMAKWTRMGHYKWETPSQNLLFWEREYTMTLFSLIKNYWEKDKRSIVVSRQLTHYLNVYLPIICQATFLIVHPENFIQFDHHHLTVYLYSVFCWFSKKRQNVCLTYKKTNIAATYYIQVCIEISLQLR